MHCKMFVYSFDFVSLCGELFFFINQNEKKRRNNKHFTFLRTFFLLLLLFIQFNFALNTG